MLGNTPNPPWWSYSGDGFILSFHGRETNIHHIATPLTSTLFCDKQFAVGINNGSKIFICVLTHICAVVWLTQELLEAEQKMNYPLEGGILTIWAGGAQFDY